MKQLAVPFLQTVKCRLDFWPNRKYLNTTKHVVGPQNERSSVKLEETIYLSYMKRTRRKSLTEKPSCFLKKLKLLHIKVRLPVLLCAVKTVEGDFRFCWTTSPNVGQTHKENPNLVRIFYMIFTWNDIYK